MSNNDLDRINYQHSWYLANRERILLKQQTPEHRFKVNERAKQYRESNRELVRQQQTTGRRNRKKRVFEHYGNKCACCGEKEMVFLTIDRLNNDGAKDRRYLTKKGVRAYRGSDSLYRKIINEGFQPVYQILCFNCNWAKSHGGCPHVNKA